MIRTFWMKIAYAIVLIASMLFSVLYLGEFSVLLLCILVFIPVFLYISLWYMKFNIEIAIKTPVTSCHRNKPQVIHLIVKNKGFLPISKASALVICSNAYTNESLPISITFPIPARNVTTAEIRITIPHCGLTEVRLKYLQFTDYIRLFGKKIRSGSSASILTLPIGTELGYKLKVPSSITDEESNVYSKLRAGDDPSEVYRIREYQPGDVQKRIHWKLSSRTDTIWVKEYSQPIKQRAAILIDYSSYDNITSDIMDNTLEAAYSLSMALIKQEIPTIIYWISDESRNLVWNEIYSIANLNDCFSSLLSHLPVSNSDELLKQTADLISIHSTNTIYYCTPGFDLQGIKSSCKAFQNNHTYVITSQHQQEQEYLDENIIFVREETIPEDLKKLSSMEVTCE